METFTYLNKGKFLISTLMLIGLFTANTSAFAQSMRKITGKVIGTNDGQPIPGANIIGKGTTNGTITDIDGNYTLNVPDNIDTLIFSFIGYKPIEEPIGNRAIINISLEEDAQKLNEVVVTALGIKREKKALGYAVQELGSDNFSKNSDPNLLNNISGKVAGVQVTGGSTGIGSSSRIVIRGENTLRGSQQPLFVIDGVPIDNSTNLNNADNNGSGTQEVDYGNGAAEINPDDIESMTVLKGPAAAALYGSRAMNGVVMITTKSGKSRRKGLGVTVNTGVSIERALRLPQYQNKFGQGKNGKFKFEDGVENNLGTFDEEDISWGPLASGQLIEQFDSPVEGANLRAGDIMSRGWYRDANGNIVSPKSEEILYKVKATPFNIYKDNVRDFFETGVTSRINVAVNGSNDNGYFRASYGNTNAKGIIPNTDLKRNNFSLGAGYNLSEKLKINAKVNYIKSGSKNRPSSGYGSESAMYIFTWYGRSVNTKSLKEYWQRGHVGREQYNYNYAWHDNPYFLLNENLNGFDKDRMFGNVSASYDILDNLKLQVRTGLDFYNDLRTSRRAFSTQRFKQGAYREDEIFFIERNTDFLLTYNTKLNKKFGLSASFGGNRMKTERRYKSTMADKLTVPGVYNFGNSAVPLKMSQFNSEKAINSLYATAQLSYNNYLFLDVTGRNDWSSTLPKGNNSYFYPSVGLSGIVSDMIDLPSFISFLKLRTSIAQVGNDTDPYQLLTTYQFNQPYGGSKPMLSKSQTLANSDLKSERQTSFEVGSDIRFFMGRLGFDFTYYNSRTKDQILSVPVSTTSGFQYRTINSGEIENSGVELMLTGRPIERKNFAWDVTLNYSKNRSKVISLADGLDSFIRFYDAVYDAEGSKVFFMAQEGQSLTSMYGRKFKRVNGQILYENGNPVIDPKIQKLGDYAPDFMLSIGNEFTYKRIKFSALVDWKQGGQMISRTKQVASYSGNLEGTENRPEGGIVGQGVRYDKATDSYVANDVAIDYRIYYRNHNNRKTQQETGIVDASFVKVREIKIGYTLPEKILGKYGIHNITLSLVGRNLYMWTPTDNKHFDPETLSLQGQTVVPGIEDMAYPSTRSFGFNASFNF